MPQETGTIVSMMYTRNFGFVTPADREGFEIFFHATAAEDYPNLHPGDQVTFSTVHTQKGLRAVGIKKVEAK